MGFPICVGFVQVSMVACEDCKNIFFEGRFMAAHCKIKEERATDSGDPD